MMAKWPYYKLFRIKEGEQDKVLASKSAANALNPLFCLWFVPLCPWFVILLKNYLPFVPLWTAIHLVEKDPPDGSRFTNCKIEQWMGQV